MRPIVLLLIFLTLASCTVTKTIEKEIPVEVETVKTQYINTVKHDSIYVKDSVDTKILNDTVFVYKFKLVYKYLNSIDTLVRRDSIQVPIYINTETIKEVNRINWYQKVLMSLGFALIIYFLFLCYRFIKKIK